MRLTYNNLRYPALDFVPGKTHDALQLKEPKEYQFENCIIDTTELSNARIEFDEACGITHGALAYFSYCKFVGAGKLVLVGSDDPEFREAEEQATVVFDHCWFDRFGRRGPEVQCGTQVYMTNCLISNWGYEDFWDVRAFGAWVHNGGRLAVSDCVFQQTHTLPFRKSMLDHANHIGQAVKDHGLKELLRSRTYMSGWRRGCTTDTDGELSMRNCWASSGVVLDELDGEMSRDAAASLIYDTHEYFNTLIVKQAKRSVL